jgi:hypothetical protein
MVLNKKYISIIRFQILAGTPPKSEIPNPTSNNVALLSWAIHALLSSE